MDEATRQNLTRNLRALVRGRGNISHVCDRIGINRQQFNKYLSGQHTPSQFNINLICQFFGVPYAELISADFVPADRVHPSETLPGFQALQQSELLKTLIRTSDTKRLRGLAGTYLKYHFSSIYRGSIVRAVTVIRPYHDLFAYSNIERFPSRSDQSRHDYVFKYHGFVFLIDDRVFMMDFEAIQKNEMTFSIYTPIIRTPLRFMFGVTTGIAANQYREPYMSKAALELLSSEAPTREHVALATVIRPDDPSIPREAAEYLSP